ncbi:DUF433 domain-containing protein [Tuwongella immobilis]|uniref:DUF433 domain-containing protein n=1 Tax=Tuwongella immobilis TaxID=692036 RepID=A0A6C2YVT1_9BACT|nr:DUF433 domain-containing protein [Tuwongella immobilis]VIP05491.1 hypothetical protein : Uncharacterized protein OS=Blastopirellula marina DSM 3645 GN=DSM3645_05465 PE=4 SV=1: DUF433 [Tuwongella immobilis]VTS08338.1 hypothetical protein : Uncharacterized protein OS=Blastopirellula marina DSM 3645 GN=DSM3645_05465 PE=4 SV=1: DUF433 [Tuwongella immobilis]
MNESKDLLDQLLELSPERKRQFIQYLTAGVPEFHRGYDRSYTMVVEERDFPSIVQTPDVCGGDARLIRTRIPIWLLEQMRQAGFSESKILESYPTLTARDLAEAWEYVMIHRDEIQKAIQENQLD